jgi:predicted phage replisome organizer
MADTKKYYWLKLKKDFFKRHDIRIIEEMPNGKEYVLLYLKLLVESISHEGCLRFSDTIPYNEQMIATITNTNIDIVRTAMKIFEQLHMVEVLDDETIYMAEVNNLIGCETEWARKKRFYRQKQLQIEDKEKTSEDIVRQEIELEKEIEIDIDIENKAKSKRFIPPSIDEVQKYCKQRNNNVDPEQFIDFYESKGWMVGKNKMKDWKAAVRTWEKRENSTSQQAKAKPTNKFTDFPQREYSQSQQAEIERKLLSKALGGKQ